LSSLNTASIFVKQNTWLKLSILLLGSVAAIIVPVKALYCLFFLTLAFLFLSPPIFKYILKGLKVILPFIAAYSLIASIMGLSLEPIIVFIVRIIIMVILVTFFSASFSMNRFLEDSRFLNRFDMFKPVMFYAVATLIYMRNFINYYKQNSVKIKVSTFDVSKIVTNLIDTIHDNWLMRSKIQSETEILLAADCNQSGFFSKGNILGCFYITTLTLVLSL